LKRLSISFRLTAWFTAVFLCGFIAFGLAMWADLAVSLSKGRDRTLTRRAARAMEALAATPAGPPAQRSARYYEFADATPEGNLIRIYDAAGRLLYPRASFAPPDFPWPDPARPASDRFRDVQFHGRKFRLLQHPVIFEGQALSVVVGGQLEDNRQMLARFSTGLMGAIPMVLMLSALAGYFVTRRALQPVGRLTAALRSITIGNLSERLPPSHTGDELDRLAETCNEMLSRLEAAVAQIKRFTADASHELRSPISYVHMVAEYALRNPRLQSESREAFQEILAESQDATRLLEDMLVLARADAGHVDIPFEPTDLAELVREAFERARIPAQTKGHHVRLRCVDYLEVRGDGSSLRRLIWTLLDNAIKYTPEGGRIEVSLDGDGEHGRFRVQDNGIGIPEELLPRVFERFFRADPARAQGEGTGLGLAIAKWIADVHQADISVESLTGAGTVFTVRFPLLRYDAGAAGPALRAVASSRI
jgi:heavy metal sensor kinase